MTTPRPLTAAEMEAIALLQGGPAARVGILAARRQSARIRPWRLLTPFRLQGTSPAPSTGAAGATAVPIEECHNDLYAVSVRRYPDGWPFGGGPWHQLNIWCHDGEPRHDWRTFQAIKNRFADEEWEAVELFPAEKRLLDPSNMFTLFCAPGIRLGVTDGRRILSPRDCVAPQRGWAPGGEPPEYRIAERSHPKNPNHS